ncbi:MAG: protein kinase, partial [Planctomycetes bacterium]|nr:protein kinase [Planctomycetota bacterium]
MRVPPQDKPAEVGAAACPDLASLQALVNGDLPSDQQADVTEHLEGCEHCQDKIEQLVTDVEGWAVAARHLHHSPVLNDELIPPRVFDVNDAAAMDAGDAPMPLDFLKPTQKEGPIGRLGHYEVLEIIGRGGMGIVLKAIDQTLQRVVAVKVLAPLLATSATARKRFIREAQAAAAVRDEHVVGIHAVEEEKGIPYLVMEYIAGISLQARIQRDGPLKVEEILRIGAQTAAGLAAAHAQGLIHRDIKPANILLENGVERVKITDFGLARASADASLTQSGVVAGTPHYMSPEQGRGERVDHRTDLFSLGSVLYAMCTGVVPFHASGSLAVLKRVCDDRPRPIADINPQIPAWLIALIDRLHAKDPANRFQTAAEVAQLLKQHLAHLHQPGTAPPGMSEGRSVSTSAPRRRRWLIVALVLAVILVLGSYWYGPFAYRVAMGRARLEFATDDPHVKVIIRQGQKEVRVVDLGDQQSIDLDAGDYDLALSDGRADLRLTETKVRLPRGGTGSAAVREVLDFAGEIRRFVGHKQHARSVAFTSDGKRALSAGSAGTVRLWDLARGTELRTFKAPGGIHQAVFSRDERRALSAGHGAICLWDLETGERLRVFGQDEEFCRVAFSSDGKQAVSASGKVTPSGREGHLRLWDLTTGQEIPRFQGHTDYVWHTAISQDGRRVLSGSWDKTARLWDMTTGQEIKRFEGHADAILVALFAPDGRQVFTASKDKTIRMWAVDTALETRQFQGHTENVESLAISPDGRRILSGGYDGTLRLWDVASGRELHRFNPGVVYSITFSPDG